MEMKALANQGALPLVHAENGDVVAALSGDVEA